MEVLGMFSVVVDLRFQPPLCCCLLRQLVSRKHAVTSLLNLSPLGLSGRRNSLLSTFKAKAKRSKWLHLFTPIRLYVTQLN